VVHRVIIYNNWLSSVNLVQGQNLHICLHLAISANSALHPSGWSQRDARLSWLRWQIKSSTCFGWE